VSTHEDEDISPTTSASLIERAPKAERLARNLLDPTPVLFGDLEGAIRRPRIDHDDLDLCARELLRLDPLQQRLKVPLFVERANDDAHQHALDL
jgi:hypothetical protein